MSVDGNSNFNVDTLANNLFGTLTAGSDFSLPAIDYDDPRFDIPDTVGNPLFTAVERIEEADLTDRTVGGTGLFDGLMVALSAHLNQEYEKGRITGKEYATVYVQLTQAALGSAVNFLTARDQTYWQSQLAQKQAQAAEIMAVATRMELEKIRAQLATARLETETTAANYALTKIKLSNEDVNYALVQAQLANTEYQTDNILPAQKAQVEAETALVAAQELKVDADVSHVTFQTGFLLPAELGKLTKETEVRDYELGNILPKEVLRIQSQIDSASAEISRITAQKDQLLYQTSAILPSQNLNIQADTDVKEYTLTSVMPSQVANMTADTAGKTFTNANILPANLLAIQEQVEAHRAKTMDTRSDGVTPVAGAIGKQMDLHQQQIDSYRRSDESKVAKMLLDTWITQKSMDEGLTPPTSLTDSNINTVMDKVRINLSLD